MERDEYLNRAVEFAARGNSLPHAKLNPAIVREIRTADKPASAWAGEMGLHIRTIEAVLSYKNWRHVDDKT